MEFSPEAVKMEETKENKKKYLPVTPEKLYHILDEIGASEDMRKTWIEFGITTEVVLNLRTKYMGKNLALFKFGSGIEGSTTPGLFSDLDFLVLNPISVYEHMDEIPKEGLHYMIVKDSETKPGYVKLQAVLDGVCLTGNDIDKVEPRKHYEVDCKGRLVRNNVTTLADMLNKPQQKGPAQKCKDHTFGSLDYVEGYYSDKQPSFATNWAKRCEKRKWPNHKTLNKLKGYGAFYVAVGHPFSKERHLEWRTSFSLQERLLAFELTPVQFKCYLFLKIIKNNFIEPVLEDTLSSYHCKTCIFHLIENTDDSFWTKGNFLCCVLECLKLLLKWVKSGVCPNFFIETENMFDRKIHGEIRQKLEDLLQDILAKWDSILYDLTCDDIGKKLLQTAEKGSSKPNGKLSETLAKIKYKIHVDKLMEVSTNTYRILHILAQDPDPLKCVEAHKNHLELMSDLKSINHQEEEITLNALKFVAPYIHTSLASNLFVLGLTADQPEAKDQYMAESAEHFKLGQAGNIVSSKLKQACTQYRAGNLQTSCEMLKELETLLDQNVIISCCGCRHTKVDDVPSVVETIKLNPTLTTQELKNQVFDCVTFQMSEMKLMPYPLRFEPFRSIGVPEGLSGGLNDYWYRTASIDGKIFMYFLQYLVYSSMGKSVEKAAAVQKMLTVLQQDENLRHRETAHNILGWISLCEGHVCEATHHYMQSWQTTETLQREATSSVSPFHNAVKWHVAIWLFQIHVVRNKQSD